MRVRPEVEDDRDGAVVDELDLHSRAEDARLDRDAELAQSGAEALVEQLGALGLRGRREARPVPLRRVREQGELADDERGAAGVEQRAVEAARGVLEYAQPGYLGGDPGGVVLAVAVRDPDEHEEAGSDLGAHGALN